MATRLAAAAAILGLGLTLPLVTAQVPDPTSGATQKVREQNLDETGAIRVHEQGTANVNVTNPLLNVGGAVSVTNFPATQNVFVTGGTLDAASLPSIAQIHEFKVNLAPGQSHQITFNATLYATTVMGASLREGVITFFSPLTGGQPLFLMWLGEHEDKDLGDQIESFAHPLPLSGVELSCSPDAADTCQVAVRILTP